MFGRKKADQVPNKVRKRIERLTTPELYNWSEALVYQTGKGFSSWRRGGGEVALDEAESAIAALLELCRELRQRERSRM